MINSKFISDILDFLLDGDELGRNARLQLNFLTENTYEYTGVGFFVSFDHSDGIEQHRLTAGKSVIDGVEITSTDLEIGAEAMVHTTDGLITTLEVWSYNGEYPSWELTDYKLKQVWQKG